MAQQLARFEVRNTEAARPSDKEYVLGEIGKWWQDGNGKEAALDAFNTFIRTRVAATLKTLQLRQERRIRTLVMLVSITIWAAV